jgi:hypothetical protein
MERNDSPFNDLKTISLPFFMMNNPMGLDKEFVTCLNKYMVYQPLAHKGSEGLLKILSYGLASLFGRGRVERQSPLAAERKRFESEVREQFVKLKEKGISIPVFTL